MPSTPRQASQVVTLPRPGALGAAYPRWLGTLAHVNGLKYSSSIPGGYESMSCTLSLAPGYRTDAMDPGRLIQIWRGASSIWNGAINEPVAGGGGGWSITGHGSGTFGSTMMSGWNPGAYALNAPVAAAIGRGLPWVSAGISSGWLNPVPVDLWSTYITDWMNNITVQAGLIWYVSGPENTLTVMSVPTTPDRILVSTVPVARTIAADINWLWYKFIDSNDGQGNTDTQFNYVNNPAACALHGNLENTIDMSGAGVMTGTQARINAQNVLNQYQRANFAGPFTVRYGQLLTVGGSPVDLGCEQIGHVCRLLVTDSPFGGEVVPGPIEFLVGGYEYDDDTQTAIITPFQNYKTDLASLLTAVIPALRQ